MDVTKPPCKKAKLMRIERKRQKLAAAGIDPETVQQQTQKIKPQNEAKSLEQFLSELPENTKHKLRVCGIFIFPLLILVVFILPLFFRRYN